MIEYKVRPVTRYVVTRFNDGMSLPSDSVSAVGRPGSRCLGEFDHAETAYAVGTALAKQEAEMLGLPPGDMGVIFPSEVPAEAVAAA